MEALPTDVLQCIFRHAEASSDVCPTALRLFFVCKRWQQCYQQDYGFWRLHRPDNTMHGCRSNPYLDHYLRLMKLYRELLSEDAIALLESFDNDGYEERNEVEPKQADGGSGEKAVKNSSMDFANNSVLKMVEHKDLWVQYEQMVEIYAYAVPDSRAMACLARHQPILEIGAATGYWAALMRAHHIQVAAFDSNSQALYLTRPMWTQVTPAQGQEVIESYAKDQWTLFLCWPPWRSPMASSLLSMFHSHGGQKVIHVGHHSCTADSAFYLLLERHWQLEEVVSIPSWPFVPDRMYVYAKK